MNSHVPPKITIIKKNTEIKEILARGKKIPTKYGVFFIDHQSNLSGLRVAVLIKKSVGQAVWRNYCKRIVRSYFRNKLRHYISKGQVIFVYSFAGKTSYRNLEEEFDKKLSFS
jgi:ribonuclease P protein component